MTDKLQFIKIFLKNNFSYITTKNKIVIGGFPHLDNFGDYINIYLVEELSGKKAVNATFLQFHPETYFNIGSILQRATPNAHIWGAGFISQNAELKHKNINIHAVRGKLTYHKLLNYFADLPEPAYGDPALLLPLLYYPEFKKKYDVGIIPHYTDKNAQWLKKFINQSHVKIIDIECGNNWRNFIKQVLSCKHIISSSLHGLIIADAYHIPNVWVKFSDNIIGGNFKFLDYYSSQNVYDISPYNLTAKTGLNFVIKNVSLCNEFNINPLIDSCPFITPDNKNKLTTRI